MLEGCWTGVAVGLLEADVDGLATVTPILGLETVLLEVLGTLCASTVGLLLVVVLLGAVTGGTTPLEPFVGAALPLFGAVTLEPPVLGVTVALGGKALEGLIPT